MAIGNRRRRDRGRAPLAAVRGCGELLDRETILGPVFVTPGA